MLGTTATARSSSTRKVRDAMPSGPGARSQTRGKRTVPRRVVRNAKRRLGRRLVIRGNGCRRQRLRRAFQVEHHVGGGRAASAQQQRDGLPLANVQHGRAAQFHFEPPRRAKSASASTTTAASTRISQKTPASHQFGAANAAPNATGAATASATAARRVG